MGQRAIRSYQDQQQQQHCRERELSSHYDNDDSVLGPVERVEEEIGNGNGDDIVPESLDDDHSDVVGEEGLEYDDFYTMPGTKSSNVFTKRSHEHGKGAEAGLTGLEQMIGKGKEANDDAGTELGDCGDVRDAAVATSERGTGTSEDSHGWVEQYTSDSLSHDDIPGHTVASRESSPRPKRVD